MKAPDKIYIYRSEKMVGFTWNSKESKEFDNIEYISKDAVLEILKNAKHLGDAACKIDKL